MSCHRSWDELASLLLREVQVIMVAGHLVNARAKCRRVLQAVL